MFLDIHNKSERNKMELKFKISVAICVTLYFATQTTTSAQGLGSQQPTLRVVPAPQPELTPAGLRPSHLIHYNAYRRDSVQKWTQKIDEFLKPYGRGPENPHREKLVHCTYITKPQDLPEGQVCDVPVHEFHPCVSANKYNYNRAAPCVFLKLDDVLNWQPKYSNNTDSVPEEMPLDLKQHIRTLVGRPEANTVWVSCEGETPTDVEGIGPLQYIPRRGFASNYYPFTNKEGYLSPLVAVLFERPRVGLVLNVQCKAWTRDSAFGVAYFQLLVDT